jgi:hypothetical protein
VQRYLVHVCSRQDMHSAVTSTKQGPCAPTLLTCILPCPVLLVLCGGTAEHVHQVRCTRGCYCCTGQAHAHHRRLQRLIQVGDRLTGRQADRVTLLHGVVDAHTAGECESSTWDAPRLSPCNRVTG